MILVKSLPHSGDLTDVGFFPSLSWAPLLPVHVLALSISGAFWCSTSMGWKVNSVAQKGEMGLGFRQT